MNYRNTAIYLSKLSLYLVTAAELSKKIGLVGILMAGILFSVSLAKQQEE